MAATRITGLANQGLWPLAAWRVRRRCWKSSATFKEFSEDGGVSIKEITNRFAEKHAEDYERKITPHWIGHLVRRKLGLKTERYREGYVIAASEGPKLERLFEKYGIENDPVNFVNSVNSEKDTEPPANPQEPLIT